MPELPITGGFYRSRSLPISAQECVNWYVNINQGDGLSKESLFGTPGATQVATTGTVKQINRGSHVLDGVSYFVNGENLYRMNSDFTLEDMGTIPGTARVSLADNGTQLMVLIPGGNGYIFTADPDTLTQITDVDFTANGVPQFVVFIDGYFVVTTDTKKFIVSDLNDGLSYDALKFGTAEADPDDIVAPIVHSNQLYIGGSQTIEVYQNVGGAGFPFQRVQGFIMPVGIKAPFSPVQASDTFMFIGGGVNDSPSVYAFTGNAVAPISHDGIDAILGELTTAELQDVFSFSYSQDAARFVGFALPDTTIVYDLTSKRWHERRSQINTVTGDQDLRWRANSLITAYGRVLIGDSQDGRIGAIDLDTFTEYDQPIVRKVATLPFSNEGKQFSISSLELTMEAGVGDLTTKDPKIRLSISKNSKTFGSELTRSIGKIGEFGRRTIWRRLGNMPRFVIAKFVMSDPVKPVIIKLEGEFS